MNSLARRVWLMVSITLTVAAVVVRLAWELTFPNEAGSLVIIALLILVTLGIYTLFLYLTIRPSLKKLKSPPVGISVMVIVTAGAISGIIHFIRFVPSPEAVSPLSIVIASLLLTGGMIAYLLILRVIWSIWKA